VPFSPTQMRVARLKAEARRVSYKFGVNVNYDNEDGTWFHVERLTLPPGWNRPFADILIDVPHGTPGYPQVAPQWFLTNSDLATSDGRPISRFFKLGQHENVNAEDWEKGWGSFCMYLKSWKPLTGAAFDQGDTLVTYLQIIMQVFHDQKSLVQ